MNQLEVLDFAIRGAKARLDTVQHLYEMYERDGDVKWMEIYKRDVNEAEDNVAELIELYQQARVEAIGVRAPREWFKRIYDI